METVRLRINWRRGLFRAWILLSVGWAGYWGYTLHSLWPNEGDCSWLKCPLYAEYIIIKGANGGYGGVERNTYDGQRIIAFRTPRGHSVSLDVMQDLKADPALAFKLDSLMAEHRAKWQQADAERRAEWRAERLEALTTQAPVMLVLPPIVVLLLGGLGVCAAPYAKALGLWALNNTVVRLANWLVAGFRY